jgi:hypothetical protein
MCSRFVIATLLLSVTLFAADPPDDSAVALARILAAKGTISASELSAVQSAGVSDRVGALAAILQRKGLLSDAEVAQFRGAASPAQPVVAAQAVVPAKAPAPSGAAQVADLPVVSRAGSALTLYGTILTNAFYNTAPGNIQDVPLFASKQGSDPSGGDKNYGMTARQTRLGLRFRQANVVGATLSGQFEFDLFGGKTPLANGMDMDLFRLRLAYGRLDWAHVAVEAGQDWGVFAPLNPTSLAGFAIPDFAASGNPWIRLPQIRAELKTGSPDGQRFLWQVAALDPNTGDYPTAAFSTSRQPGVGERGRMPAIETRLAWTDRLNGQDATLAVSGHYGRGKNFAAVNNANLIVPVDSWGVALDYTLPFTRWFNLSGEAFTGRELGIYSVTLGEGVGTPGGIGGHGVESHGGWAQAQFNFTKQWQSNLGYGIETPKAAELPVGNRWRNQTYMGNLIYKLTPNVSLAAEYRRILTDYRNQPSSNERGDHVNLAVGYIF